MAPPEAGGGVAADDERERLADAADAGPLAAEATPGAAKSLSPPTDAVATLANQLQRGSPAAVTAAAEAVGASGSSKSAGGTASSGLMIDGFLVPPHVLQALQELRLSGGGGSIGPKQLESLAKEGVVLSRTSPPPAEGQENEGPAESAATDRPSSDAAVSVSPSDNGPFPSPPSSEAAVPESCGSPQHSLSSSGRGRASAAGYAGGSSRGSSRSSGRHSSRSGASGRSSGSGRSARGRNSPGLRHSGTEDSENDEHVHGLEAAVAELSARSAANAAVITQLNTDITSLSTTNESLRQRLTLLTSQLRHRDVEIDHLRNDVRRLRALMAGPIDNRAGASGGSRGGARHR